MEYLAANLRARTMRKVWSSHCRLLLWSLAVFSYWNLSQGTPCFTTRLVGEDCPYLCHCRSTNDKCDRTTGECLGRSVCARGWFGPACQYVDWASSLQGNEIPAWLSDRDDNTCNPDMSNVTVQLSQPLPFTWLRLHVSDKDDLNTIEVQFKNDSNPVNDNIVDCNNKRTATVSDTGLDIYCDLDIYVQQVILAGQGVKSLCSVYVSGGRIVTLGQPTKQSSTYKSSQESSRAVDGYSGQICARTQLSLEPQWNVTFEHSQAINILNVIYIAGASYTQFTHLLTWYNINGSELLQAQRDITDSSGQYMSTTSGTDIYAVYNITRTRPMKPVSIINIRPASTLTSRKYLELCEVWAYGDTVCPQGKYGRECEHSCDNCLNQECFVATGGCPLGCVDGFVGGQCETPCPATTYGKDCTENCSINCKDQLCDHINGTCQQCVPGKIGDQCDKDCPPTTYGPNCEMPCSTNCENQLCDPVLGYCTECQPKMYGQNCEMACSTNCEEQLCDPVSGSCIKCQLTMYGTDCEMSCSTNCKDQLCDPVSGKCNKCPAGYFGDVCDNTCQFNTYGQDCAQTCSINCVRNETVKDSVCDHVNGSCILGCMDGFTGSLCEERNETSSGQGDDSTSLSSSLVSAVVGAVVAVVLIIAVIIAVLLWRRRKRNKDGKSIYVNESTPATADTNNRTSTVAETPYEPSPYEPIQVTGTQEPQSAPKESRRAGGAEMGSVANPTSATDSVRETVEEPSQNDPEAYYNTLLSKPENGTKYANARETIEEQSPDDPSAYYNQVLPK